MKKLIVSLLIILSAANVFCQTTSTFVYLVTYPCIQDSGSPVISSNKTFIAPKKAATLPANDSIFYNLVGTQSRVASDLTDSLIMPLPFQRSYTSGVMDLGIRADSTGVDSVMIYQNNIKIYTYKTGATFQTADVYFNFTSGQFLVPQRFVVKPVLARNSSKKRTVHVNPNYYQQ